MNKTPWYIVGILFLCPAILCAQKKKNTLIDTPVVVAIKDPEFTFSQGVGISLFSSKEKKQDTLQDNIKQLNTLGARMVKLDLPSGENINLLIDSPVTHYFFTIKLDLYQIDKNNDEAKNEFYKKIYHLAKDFLTRRGTSEKTIFIGIALSLNQNAENTIDGVNLMVRAIDDARTEVKYTRCKIFSYTILDGSADSFISPPPILSKINSHYILFHGDELKEKSVGEIKTWLNNFSTHLGYRSEQLGNRVFVSDGGFTQQECAGDLKIAQKKNQIFIKKLMEAGVPYIFLKNLNSLEDAGLQSSLYLKFKEVYAKQVEAAQEMKLHKGRYPTTEEMLSYSATLF